MTTLTQTTAQENLYPIKAVSIWTSEDNVKCWIDQLTEDFTSTSDVSSPEKHFSLDSDVFLAVPNDGSENEADELELGAEAKHFSLLSGTMSPRISPMASFEDKESLKDIQVNTYIQEEKDNFDTTLDQLLASREIDHTPVVVVDRVDSPQPQPSTTLKQLFQQDRSLTFDEMSSNDASSLFDMFTTNAEDVLYDLGFGKSSSKFHSIPDRFFQQPSSAFGIDVDEIHYSMLMMDSESFHLQNTFDRSDSNPMAHPRFSESSIDLSSLSSDNPLSAKKRRILFKSNNADIPSIHLSQDEENMPRSTSPSSTSSMLRKLSTLEEVPEPLNNSFDSDKGKLSIEGRGDTLTEDVTVSPHNLLFLKINRFNSRNSVSDKSTSSLATVIHNQQENIKEPLNSFKPISISEEFPGEIEQTEKGIQTQPLIPTPAKLSSPQDNIEADSISVLSDCSQNRRSMFARVKTHRFDELKDSDINEDTLNWNAADVFNFNTDDSDKTKIDEPMKDHQNNDQIESTSNVPAKKINIFVKDFFKRLKTDNKKDKDEKTKVKLTITIPDSDSQNSLVLSPDIVPNNKKGYLSAAFQTISRKIMPNNDSSENKFKKEQYEDVKTSKCDDVIDVYADLKKSYSFENFNDPLLINRKFTCATKNNDSAYFSSCSPKLESLASSDVDKNIKYSFPKFLMKGGSTESSGYDEDRVVKCPFGKNCSINHGLSNARGEESYSPSSLCAVCDKINTETMAINHEHFDYLVQQIACLRSVTVEQNRLHIERESRMKEYFADLLLDMKIRSDSVIFDRLNREVSKLKEQLQKLKNGENKNQHQKPLTVKSAKKLLEERRKYIKISIS